MLSKIIEATKGKPCSCPTGKICPACKTKKPVRVKPHVYIEGFKALPVPVKITTYKDKTHSTVLQPHRKKTTIKKETPKTQSFQKIKTWSHYRKPAPTECASQGTSICRWYKRRKALRDLKKITRLERKKLERLHKEQAQREREAEFLQQLMQREKEIRHVEQQLAASPKASTLLYYECPKKVCGQQTTLSEPKTKTKKENIKTEANLCRKPEVFETGVRIASYVLADGLSKFATPQCSVKTCRKNTLCSLKDCKKYTGECRPCFLEDQKTPISEKFSNFCYRICCHFYCCMSFLMIIGFLIIYFT